MYRKGTILLRKKIQLPDSNKLKLMIAPLHRDMIQEDFWTEHNEIISKATPQVYSFEFNNDEDLPALVLKQIEKLNLKSKGNLN